MPLATFVADEVIVTMGGHIFGGWPPGARISVEQADDTWTTVSGTDLISRGLTYTGLFTVTVTLQQTSGTNDELTAFHDLDIQTRLGFKTFSITDVFGTSKMMSPNAFIMKLPNQETAVEVGTREWSITCPDVTGMVVGGNATV